MNTFLLLIALFLFTQCRNDKVVKVDANKFFEINYEKILENKETFSLSEIASEVRYIPLETGNNFLVFRNPTYYFSENFIFVSNLDHILVYDYTGKFIRKIGTHGRGPGEIDLIRIISIIEKEQIVIVQTNWSRKLMYFSFDGKFIKSITLPTDVFRVRVLNKNLFLLHFSCSQGFEDYLYILSNEKWDTISKINNHFKWTNSTGLTGMWGINDYRPFYNFRNQTYFKSMYNDTVFTITDNKIEPAYFINLGKCRLPNELRPEPPQSALRFRSENNKYFFAEVMEAGEMIFITTKNYKVNVQKNILFDSNITEGSLLVNESNNPSGLINDWDGGTEFWPEGNVNDNEIFMPLSSLTLKNLLKERDFSKATIRFPEKKKALIEMTEKLNETDNPVLMIVKLKN
jgi:hypothetical protein